MLNWIREPRVAGGQEMTYGRSLQRHLYHFGLPTVFTEWAHLAQDRAGWHKPVTTPPFAIGKPFVRQPRGDTRVTPEDKRWAVAPRAAEIAELRGGHRRQQQQLRRQGVHWHPCTRRPELDVGPPSAPGRAWG